MREVLCGDSLAALFSFLSPCWRSRGGREWGGGRGASPLTGQSGGDEVPWLRRGQVSFTAGVVAGWALNRFVRKKLLDAITKIESAPRGRWARARGRWQRPAPVPPVGPRKTQRRPPPSQKKSEIIR